MKRLSQLPGRSKSSAEEIPQLGNGWTKRMVDQWQPIFGFVERRIKYNGTQSPVDPNSNRRVSNGSQLDVPLTLSYLLEQAGMVLSHVTILAISLYMTWRIRTNKSYTNVHRITHRVADPTWTSLLFSRLGSDLCRRLGASTRRYPALTRT